MKNQWFSPRPERLLGGMSARRLASKDISEASEPNLPEILCFINISLNEQKRTSSFLIFQSKVSCPRRDGWWVAMAMSSSSSSLISRLPRHNVRRFPDILAKLQHISESFKPRLDSQQPPIPNLPKAETQKQLLPVFGIRATATVVFHFGLCKNTVGKLTVKQISVRM